VYELLKLVETYRMRAVGVPALQLVVVLVVGFLLCLLRPSRSLGLADGQLNHRRLKNEGRRRRIERLTTVLRDRNTALTPSQRKELAGLVARGDPYDDALFDDDHVAFKEAHNAAFVALATTMRQRRTATDSVFANDDAPDWGPRRRRLRPVVYLDGPSGATTKALLEAGFDRRSELYTANEWQGTRRRLRTDHSLAHCYLGRVQDVLLREDAVATVPFVAAYFDGCSGDPRTVLEMIGSLVKTPTTTTTMAGAGQRHQLDRDDIAASVAIGFTLTKAEPAGRELLDRVQDVTRGTLELAASRGYRMHHVGDDPGRFGVDPELVRQHDGTATTWLVLERIR